jgi:hypothetical protein
MQSRPSRAPIGQPTTFPPPPLASLPPRLPIALPKSLDFSATRSRVPPEAKLLGISAKVCLSKDKKKWRPAAHEDLRNRHDYWMQLILAPYGPQADFNLVRAVATFFQGALTLDPPIPPNEYLSYFLGLIDDPSKDVPPTDHPLAAAKAKRKTMRRNHRMAQRKATEGYVVFKSPQQYLNHHLLILHVYLRKLEVPSPAPEHYVDDTSDAATFQDRADFFATKRLPDNRKSRKGVLRIEDRELQMSIPPDASCLVYDVDTKELVLSVVRNFSHSPPILKWMQEIVTEANESRLSVRVSSSPLSFADIRSNARSA